MCTRLSVGSTSVPTTAMLCDRELTLLALPCWLTIATWLPYLGHRKDTAAPPPRSGSICVPGPVGEFRMKVSPATTHLLATHVPGAPPHWAAVAHAVPARTRFSPAR